MASTSKDPVLVVLQLSGGNDALNTVIPYTNPRYFDNRPKVGIPADQVLPINDTIGFHPAMGPIKKLYDEGKVADYSGHRLSQAEPLALPLHGYLAYLRAGKDR